MSSVKNFLQFVVINKGFSVVNEAEVDGFLEFSCFFYDPVDVSNLISGSSAKAFDCVDHNKLWKILKRDENTRSPFLPPEKSVCRSRTRVRTGPGTTDCFQIGKGVHQAIYCHPAYLTYMQSTS